MGDQSNIQLRAFIVFSSIFILQTLLVMTNTVTQTTIIETFGYSGGFSMTMFTAPFIHISFAHGLTNLVSLLYFILFFTSYKSYCNYTSKEYSALFILTSIIGFGGSAIFYTYTLGEFTVSIGLSIFVLALFGVGTVTYILEKLQTKTIHRTELFIIYLIVSVFGLIVYSIYNILTGISIGGVSHFGHVIGYLIGVTFEIVRQKSNY